jgi:hypothetical protein
MKQAKLFILSLGLAIVCGFATGCIGVSEAKALKDAVDRAMISGLSASNHCNIKAIVWGFPSLPSGPFSKIGSLPVMVNDGSTNSDWYVFFCGKSENPKAWQMFSCMKWQDDHWESVSVTLPKLQGR